MLHSETRKTITILLAQHKASGLLAAYSRDLPGLLATGANEAQVRERLPGLITQLEAARGRKIVSVEILDADDVLPDEFETPNVMVANTVICEAH